MITLPAIPGDLAPGDARALAMDRATLRFVAVDAPDHPLFDRAYRRLWDEFGARGEMESRDVIAARLAWRPPLLYQLVVALDGDDLVGLRDHTAIAGPDLVVVHLSHVVVEPPHRGGGLAGWLRAIPLQAARACAPGCDRVVLAGEMEHPDGTPATLARLRSYQRAGFLKVDPAAFDYAQPDFRAPAEIDATGVRPVPLMLVVRRVGAEAEPTISGAELRTIVEALYRMFAVHARPEHMAPLWARLARLPAADAAVRLLPPLATS